ncbi:heterokaryon incompatibility protein-domain-containing protein [Xylaria digitata]|nr:heterokaryon incompatibility protein-domain-containing protein [Xylaria digitata]
MKFAGLRTLKAQDANHSSMGPNGLSLCKRCIVWGHISIHSLDEPHQQKGGQYTTIHQAVTFEQLAQEPRCAICTHVLAAYHARVQYAPDVQSLPAAEVGIELSGPFYLDTGGLTLHSQDERSPRYGDRSDPTAIVIGTFLRLTVKRLVPEKREDKSMQSIINRRASSPSPPNFFSGAPTLFIITPQFRMTYSNNDAPVLIGIQEWVVPFFDTKLLSCWLESCEEQHAGQCGGKEIEKENLPVGFRLIDTYEDKITGPVGSFRYVALSYMWKVGPDNNIKLEKSNADLLATPHSLRQVQLPNIITDAIALCRDLGQRYLWVDRLCIEQDNEITKPGQINAMDRIYRSASFTIIGALNTRYDIGLPGCAGRPRQLGSPVWSPPYKPEVETQGVICNDTADEAIDTTLWNRRGWTFQERLLSSRCLYITDHQVIYKCCQGEAMEMLTWTIHSEPPSSQQCDHHDDNSNSSEGDSDSPQGSGNRVAEATKNFKVAGSFNRGKYSRKGTQFTIQDGIKLTDYFDWVKDYSSRQLSIAKDIFNAFSGVSNALRESFKSRMLFGIPERYMAVCLCWDCPGPFSPRGEIHDVPSWSWVSSSSAVSYDCENETLGRDFLHIASLIYFYYQDPDGHFRKLEVEERWVQNIISIQELSGRDELPPLSGSKGLPGEWRTNKDWKECPQNPWVIHEHQAIDPDARLVAALFPGSLVFNTTVASLKIGESSTNADSEGETNTSDAPLVNMNGETVGTIIMMNRGWIETHCSSDGVQKLFEFAVISGRLQKYSARKMLAWMERYSDIWELNVIMVERLPCKPFVARRIGVGTVMMCKWKDCSPRWETVVLC